MDNNLIRPIVILSMSIILFIIMLYVYWIRCNQEDIGGNDMTDTKRNSDNCSNTQCKCIECNRVIEYNEIRYENDDGCTCTDCEEA